VALPLVGKANCEKFNFITNAKLKFTWKHKYFTLDWLMLDYNFSLISLQRSSSSNAAAPIASSVSAIIGEQLYP